MLFLQRTSVGIVGQTTLDFDSPSNYLQDEVQAFAKVEVSAFAHIITSRRIL